jgi:glycosyltransferase involved in cell wall biosynthesis
MNISIIIPIFNEAESLIELIAWIEKVMSLNHFTFEVIMIDDGSRDASLEIIRQIASEKSFIKCISFRRNYGKSAALNEGFKAAQGDVVVTMDADLQDSPEEIPEMYRMITEQKFELVSGWKKKRHDPLSKTIPTKIYNWVTRKLTRIKLHDFNCGLKAYKNEVIKTIEVYGEMHRYIPVIAKWNGFYNIGERVVEHQARKYGYSKYGFSRFIYGFLDLFSIMFVSKFGKRPMHFFGTMGVISFFIGFVLTAWLIGEKIYAARIRGFVYRDITAKPHFYIALLLLIIGVVLFLAGFLGELIYKNTTDKGSYPIKEKINISQT